MIWQSSSEADSQAASESELAVQAAAAVPAESDSDSGTRESRPTRAAVTVTRPWLLTTRKSCRQLERRWQTGGPASSPGMTPHWADNFSELELVCHCGPLQAGDGPGTMSTQPTECRMKPT